MKNSLFSICFFILATSLLKAQSAPDFTIDATDNAQHQLYNDYLNNGKTVVLDIMFTTCPPCNNIAPFVELLNQDWGAGQQDVVFFSLSDKSFDDNSDVAAWELMHGLTYHGAGQDGGSLSAVAPYKAGTYGPFNGTPTFVVIAPDGTVSYNPRGSNIAATIDSIDAAIESTGAQRPQTQFTLGGIIQKENGTTIADVEVFLSGQGSPLLSNTDGSYQFFPVDLGNTVSIRPQKQGNTRNGLSVLDLILIQRHLLFVDRFDSPYLYFAADVNNNKAITVADLVWLQRMILFVDDEFPNNDSWRFIPEDFVFLNPNNPLLLSPPDNILYNSVDDDHFDGHFVAIKVGDVSGNANPGALPSEEAFPTAQSEKPILLFAENRFFEAGEIFDLSISAAQWKRLAAFQVELKLPTEEFDIIAAQKPNQEEVGQLLISVKNRKKGKIGISWFNSGIPETGSDQLVKLRLRAKVSGHLSDYLQITENDLPAKFYSIANGQNIQEHPVNLSFTESLTGVSDKGLWNPISTVRVYPNPVKNSFTIATEETWPADTQIELLHPSGKTIAILATAGDHKTKNNRIFSIASQASGMYLLKIQSPRYKPLIIKLIKI